MKNIIGSLFVLACVAGCSHNAPMPQVAYQVEPLPKKCDEPKDNFDKVGDGVTYGTRKFWDYTQQAWVWVSSDENQQRAINALRTAKESAIKAYEYTKQTYQEHQ